MICEEVYFCHTGWFVNNARNPSTLNAVGVLSTINGQVAEFWKLSKASTVTFPQSTVNTLDKTKYPRLKKKYNSSQDNIVNNSTQIW